MELVLPLCRSFRPTVGAGPSKDETRAFVEDISSEKSPENLRRSVPTVKDTVLKEHPALIRPSVDLLTENLPRRLNIGTRNTTRMGRDVYDTVVNKTFLSYGKGRLKAHCWTRLKNLYFQKYQEWKQTILTVDGAILSLSVAFLDYRGTYGELSDMIRKCLLSNAIMNRSSFIKNWKRFVKGYRKAYFTRDSSFSIPREFAILRKHPLWEMFLQRCKDPSPLLSSEIWRVGTFCQTRSLGLATDTIARESLEALFELIKDKETVPGITRETVRKSMETIHEVFLANWKGRKITTFQNVAGRVVEQKVYSKDPTSTIGDKITLPTTGCLEATVEAGGKAKAAKDLLDRFVNGEPFLEVDLNTGAVMGVLDKKDFLIDPLKHAYDAWDLMTANIFSNRFGYLMLQLALNEEHNRNEEQFLCRTVTVREQGGKARVVTETTFVRSTILQPYSHEMIEHLKVIPSVSSGLEAGRHDWNFFKSLGSTFGPVGKRRGLSYDLKTATDSGLLQVASWILEDYEDLFLDNKLKYYHGTAREIYLRPLTVENKTSKGITHRATRNRGWLMGDPMTKGILTFAQLIAYYASAEFNELRLGKNDRNPLRLPKPEAASFVGDDGAIVHTESSPMRFANHLNVLRSMGLVISEDDTFESSEVITYTEGYVNLTNFRAIDMPDVKTNDENFNKYSSFVDVPKMRLLTGVLPDRPVLSGTLKGRLALIGRECEWAPKITRGLPLLLWSIACTAHGERPDIVHLLPSAVAGAGIHVRERTNVDRTYTLKKASDIYPQEVMNLDAEKVVEQMLAYEAIDNIESFIAIRLSKRATDRDLERVNPQFETSLGTLLYLTLTQVLKEYPRLRELSADERENMPVKNLVSYLSTLYSTQEKLKICTPPRNRVIPNPPGEVLSHVRRVISEGITLDEFFVIVEKIFKEHIWSSLGEINRENAEAVLQRLPSLTVTHGLGAVRPPTTPMFALQIAIDRAREILSSKTPFIF